MMTTSNIFTAEDNLAKTLGLTPGFTKYLTEIVSGMHLESKHIKESAICRDSGNFVFSRVQASVHAIVFESE